MCEDDPRKTPIVNVLNKFTVFQIAFEILTIITFGLGTFFLGAAAILGLIGASIIGCKCDRGRPSYHAYCALNSISLALTVAQIIFVLAAYAAYASTDSDLAAALIFSLLVSFPSLVVHATAIHLYRRAVTELDILMPPPQVMQVVLHDGQPIIIGQPVVAVAIPVATPVN